MKTQIIKLRGKVVAQIIATDDEFSVLKLALRKYGNGYGLDLLKKIKKAEL